MNKKEIGPSILNANFLNLEKDLSYIKEADYIHIDIMDGNFVPNISFGPDTVKQIKGITNLPLDCHLMVSNPIFWVEKFRDLEVNSVTVHAEATTIQDLLAIKKVLETSNTKLGLSFNPNTKIEGWSEVFEILDRILLMSVFPGFGGQKFISEVLQKVDYINNYNLENDKKIYIEIDGGINRETIQVAKKYEINGFVIGSAIFNSSNPEKELQVFRQILNG